MLRTTTTENVWPNSEIAPKESRRWENENSKSSCELTKFGKKCKHLSHFGSTVLQVLRAVCVLARAVRRAEPLCVSGRVIPVEGPRLDVLTVRHNLLQPMLHCQLAAPIIPTIPFLTMASRLFSGNPLLCARPCSQIARGDRLCGSWLKVLAGTLAATPR